MPPNWRAELCDAGPITPNHARPRRARPSISDLRFPVAFRAENRSPLASASIRRQPNSFITGRTTMDPQNPPTGSPDFTERQRPELTIRGLIVGVLITLVFTAANVYFGLKAGLTFSTSIPAAVISMAILRTFKNATVQENNIVQTVASAAGTLSSIIFV